MNPVGEAPAAPATSTQDPVLVVTGLRVTLNRPGSAPCDLVRDVSVEIGAGEIVCMVGESGSGKSLSALAIMGLLGEEPNLRVGGRVHIGGRDLFALSPDQQRETRGRDVTMVFQEPMSSLDPVMRVGAQVTEAVRRAQSTSRAQARDRTLDLLRQVGLPDVERVYASYPHQLSGGMCQRVMIAMALAPRPRLLVADEPTTALDVTVQAQIIDLLLRLREQEGMSILLITHDMAVAAAIADRVVVVYAGRTVEVNDVTQIFAHPEHPYTAGLLRSVPRLDGQLAAKTRLQAIAGTIPEPSQLPAGCAFAPRCELAVDRCRAQDPPLEVREPGRAVACWVATGHA
jgi:peptide/nickel transport system ATP-binding protein